MVEVVYEVVKMRPLWNQERNLSDAAHNNIIYTDSRWWVDLACALECMQYITVRRACFKWMDVVVGVIVVHFVKECKDCRGMMS